MKLTSMGLSDDLLEASRTVLQNSKDYEEFFKSALKKFGVDSPADFKSDEEKKKFFDYIDKNYKGEKEEQKESVKKFSRSYRLDEASLNYVYFDKAEATKFMSKVKNFVDSAEMEKAIAGHYNVKLKGDKKSLKKATDVAIKMSESVEPLDEGKKGKYKGKGISKIVRELAKLEKDEKKDFPDQAKKVKEVSNMIKKGLETEMYDDMEILTQKALKALDKLINPLDTMVRDGIAQAIEKNDPDLYDMIYGY